MAPLLVTTCNTAGLAVLLVRVMKAKSFSLNAARPVLVTVLLIVWFVQMYIRIATVIGAEVGFRKTSSQRARGSFL